MRSRTLELLEKRDWDAALDAAGQWYRLALASIEAEQFLDHVRTAVREGRQPGPGETGPDGRDRESVERDEEKVRRLLEVAEKAEESEEWTVALESYDLAMPPSGFDPGIAQRRSAVRDKLRESLEPLFVQAREASARHDLDEASRLFERLSKLLPWDVEPLHEWERVRDQRIASHRTRKRRSKFRWKWAYAAAVVPLILLVLVTSPGTRRSITTSSPPVRATGVSAAESALPPAAGKAAQEGRIALDGSWSDPGAGGEARILTVAGQRFTFRWIPPGEAVLGSPVDDPCRDGDETQWTARFTNGFWMAETEITRTQWNAVMDTAEPSAEDCPDCPVAGIDWHAARSFAQALNAEVAGGRFRLPFEAEWEYAARAGSEGPFGLACPTYPAESCEDRSASCLDVVAWHLANTPDGRPRPVGSKQPNGWGLHDMHGNVAEWCQDWYAAYPEGALSEYTGPPRGSRRVLRGGAVQDPRFLRSANRRAADPSFASGTETGFRIVLIVE